MQPTTNIPPKRGDYVPVVYAPVSGVNSTDSLHIIDDTKCGSGTLNFLFEGGEALTRPGEQVAAMATNAAPTWWAQGIDVGGLDFVLMAVGTGPSRVWYLSTGGNTEITGPGTNFNSSPVSDFNAASVNGVTLIGGSSSGALRWDPVGNVYTVLATAPWKYLVSHLSRAFGAYDLSSGTPGARTVGWSVAGDETTWTGATNGSGRSVIADVPDSITGLGVMRDVVIIFRHHGIHLAYPTGLAFPAYRITTWNRAAKGCAFPTTLACNDNVSYFVSYDDVMRFDLVSMKPIGYEIRKQLFNAMGSNTGVLYRGLLVYTQAQTATITVPREWYVLVPVWGSPTGTGAANVAPIFVYDTKEDSWSVHDFAEAVNAAAYDNRTFTGQSEQGFVLFDTASPTNYRGWRRGTACERPASLLTKVKVAADDPMSDFLIERALLSYRSQGIFNVTVKVTCEKRGTLFTFQDTEATGGVTAYWSRLWFNLRQNAEAGQNFQVEIDVPAGNNFTMDYVGLQSVRAGDYRG